MNARSHHNSTARLSQPASSLPTQPAVTHLKCSHGQSCLTRRLTSLGPTDLTTDAHQLCVCVHRASGTVSDITQPVSSSWPGSGPVSPTVSKSGDPGECVQQIKYNWIVYFEDKITTMKSVTSCYCV
ncbi:hypothetical protein BsWGS_28026 [Bradybaena similaris]